MHDASHEGGSGLTCRALFAATAGQHITASTQNYVHGVTHVSSLCDQTPFIELLLFCVRQKQYQGRSVLPVL